MNQEIKNLLTVYENKLIAVSTLEGELGYCSDNEYYRKETKQAKFQIESDLARAALVAAIERLEKRASDASWEHNPDRMGGMFTQEEIDRASRGGEGW